MAILKRTCRKYGESAPRKSAQNPISGNDKSANVNISSFGFQLKVVALEYESDDTPDKLIAYYRDQLKKYGNVPEVEAKDLAAATRATLKRGALEHPDPATRDAYDGHYERYRAAFVAAHLQGD